MHKKYRLISLFLFTLLFFMSLDIKRAFDAKATLAHVSHILNQEIVQYGEIKETTSQFLEEQYQVRFRCIEGCISKQNNLFTYEIEMQFHSWILSFKSPILRLQQSVWIGYV